MKHRGRHKFGAWKKVSRGKLLVKRRRDCVKCGHQQFKLDLSEI